MPEFKPPPIKFDKVVPFLFDRKDLPIRVSLYPTGHLAVGAREYVESLGFDDIEVDLQIEIQDYLHRNWSKPVFPKDADTISKDVKEMIDKWAKARKKSKKSVKNSST